MFVNLNYRFSPSEDAISEFENVLSSAKNNGIDGLCLRLAPGAEGAQKLIDAGKKAGVPVFISREYRTSKGVIVGLYSDPDDPGASNEPLEEPQAAINFIRSKGGVAIVSQPYSRSGETPVLNDAVLDLENFQALEVIHAETSGGAAEMAFDVAQNLNVKTVAGGSDADGKFVAGMFFANPPSSQTEFIEKLLSTESWVFIIGKDPMSFERSGGGRDRNRDRRGGGRHFQRRGGGNRDGNRRGNGRGGRNRGRRRFNDQ